MLDGNGRWDHRTIYKLVEHGSSVLDIGCGEGGLLSCLQADKDVRGYGIDISWKNIALASQKGVSALQLDVDQGIEQFPPGHFDFVILEKTLQVVHHPIPVLKNGLRVGKKVIVSFPNFAHWQVAQTLVATGRMPVTPDLPFAWHSTPNIHLLTINDFLDWAEESGVNVIKGFCLVEGEVKDFRPLFLTRANEALFMISKERGSSF